MVRVVDCHAGVLGSNPGGPKRFSPWNYFSFKLTLQNRVGGVKLLQQLHNQPGYKMGILTKYGKTIEFT